MRLSRSARPAAILTAAATMLAVGATQAPTAAVTDPVSEPGEAVLASKLLDQTVDIRDTAGRLIQPTSTQRAAVEAMVERAGPDTTLTWDRRFGTPRTIYAPAGSALSGAYDGSALDAARAFVRDRAAGLGLSVGQVRGLEVTRNHRLPDGIATVIGFTQTWDGVSATQGGSFSVTVDSRNRVAAVAGSIARNAATLGSFDRTAGQALEAAGESIDPDLSLSTATQGTQGGYTVLGGVGKNTPSYAQRVAFPTADGARLAYRVLLVKSHHQAWDTVVDAASGDVLYRANLVAHDSEGTIYRNFPGAPGGGEPEVRSFGPTEQSPSGWVDPTGIAGLPGPTTAGNNASSYANWSNFIVPADQGPRPVSPTSQFNYAFADNWGRTQCEVPSYAQDVNPAATNLFYHHNRIHDEFYRLGFTESGDNFQVNNGGSEGGGDPILGLVQAGAATGGAPLYTGRDNAYMLTLPDGIPPWSGMFLWEPINDAFEGPCADGDFDAGVIEHEYAHGLTNRYVGTEDNALNTHQSGSMGEGWGDWFALNYLHREGLSDDSVVGAYVTGNNERGIRNWSYDDNPTGFGDIGYDIIGAEVHADGEIWTTTLWDLRKDLVAAYGQQEGGSIAEHIVTDAMPISPNDPSMLDMRDAIREALALRYHRRADFGALQDTVYAAFAGRGMGVDASNNVTEADPTGGNDTDPTPSFEHQNPAHNGVIRGTVVNTSTGDPVADARVMLGRFEARVSPVATTGDNGVFRIPASAGSYPLTIQARGFGSRTWSSVTSTAGSTTEATYRMRPNMASEANGAKVTSSTTSTASNALDDTEATIWKSPAGSGRMVVELAEPTNITQLQVSAFTASRFEALRSFTVQVSDDGVNWQTVPIGQDAFSYQKPRPVVPDVHYKRFALETPVRASYIRFWTDEPMGDTKESVQVGDVQVFGTGTGAVVPLPPPPPDPPFTEEFTIVGSNPSGDNTDGGATGLEFAQSCTYPPASQGLDGWVTKLPEGFGDGAHKVRVTAESPSHDLDLYFYDAECTPIGSAASSSANESGTIPSGTAYVVTHAWLGANVPVTLLAEDTR
ncbi:MAG TPA: M36 family metallopeptidase [Nocardioidaceae bacterium]|nr:M36 family metallopeptidase [Nocardioidaceae bacterium]